MRSFYAASEAVPLEHVVPEDWLEAVVDPDTGWSSGSRMSCVSWWRCARRSAAARSGWRAPTRWRNPDDDLPVDFEDNRDVHYEALSKPRDPAEFIADLQKTARRGAGPAEQGG